MKITMHKVIYLLSVLFVIGSDLKHSESFMRNGGRTLHAQNIRNEDEIPSIKEMENEKARLISEIADIRSQITKVDGIIQDQNGPLQISVYEATKESPIRHGDILSIHYLKPQNNTSLQQIVQKMNYSFGIAMEHSWRTRRKRMEVRVKWMVDKSVKAGIKPKYLSKGSPNIYIHCFCSDIDGRIDCLYQTEIIQALIKQNDGNNVILNQIGAQCSYNIDSDILAFPVFAIWKRINKMDCNNQHDIYSFLRHEFNVISSSMYKSICGKLIMCKKVHKARKKVMPFLDVMHKEQKGHIGNVSREFDKALECIYKLLNDPKTQREYKAFFMAFQQVCAAVAVETTGNMLHITGTKRLIDNVELDSRTMDLVNAFQKVTLDNLSGDVHVFYANNTHWDYALIRRNLLKFMKYAEYNDDHEESILELISEAVVKIVKHPDTMSADFDI